MELTSMGRFPRFSFCDGLKKTQEDDRSVNELED